MVAEHPCKDGLLERRRRPLISPGLSVEGILRLRKIAMLEWLHCAKPNPAHGRPEDILNPVSCKLVRGHRHIDALCRHPIPDDRQAVLLGTLLSVA